MERPSHGDDEYSRPDADDGELEVDLTGLDQEAQLRLLVGIGLVARFGVEKVMADIEYRKTPEYQTWLRQRIEQVKERARRIAAGEEEFNA